MEDFRDYKLLLLKELENINTSVREIKVLLNNHDARHEETDVRITKIEHDFKWTTKLLGFVYTLVAGASAYLASKFLKS
ncbi:MAG: hypothetical protein E6R04_03230 [Spirochaetes bacterium]|nr:MAG: hypothetical protein E6R04_03230 [Spirochaetota bacterium]